jgi:hypothetical protein
MNEANVVVDLFDVYGYRIHDDVVLSFHNTDVVTFSRTYHIKLDGKPEIISGVPSFPTGHAMVDIKPSKYQERRILISVVGPSVGKNEIKEQFFIDPAKADPKQISYAELPNKSYWSKLKDLLDHSTPKIDAASWNSLEPVNRATILNLCSKMVREKLTDGSPVVDQIRGIDLTWLNAAHRERIYCPVSDEFLTQLRKLPDNFKVADGSTHHYPNNWIGISQKPFSFKSKDAAGNIQFTFAADSQGKHFCDIDLDDHSGIKHAIDYIEHKLFKEETHPYTIHELLVKYQDHGDPEYFLL